LQSPRECKRKMGRERQHKGGENQNPVFRKGRRTSRTRKKERNIAHHYDRGNRGKRRGKRKTKGPPRSPFQERKGGVKARITAKEKIVELKAVVKGRKREEGSEGEKGSEGVQTILYRLQEIEKRRGRGVARTQIC